MPNLQHELDDLALFPPIQNPQANSEGWGGVGGALAIAGATSYVLSQLGKIPIIGGILKAVSGTLPKATQKAAERSYAKHSGAMAKGTVAAQAASRIISAGSLDAVQNLEGSLTQLWRKAIPTRINAHVRPVVKVAHRAETLAHRGIGDAAIAERLAKSADRAAKRAVASADSAFGRSKNYTDTQVKRHGGITAREADRIATREANARVRAGNKASGKQISDRLGLGVTAGVGVGAAVIALAESAGLDRAQCRTNTRGICATNPQLWGNLLAGLAFAGAVYDLSELLSVSRSFIDTAGPVIAKL